MTSTFPQFPLSPATPLWSRRSDMDALYVFSERGGKLAGTWVVTAYGACDPDARHILHHSSTALECVQFAHVHLLMHVPGYKGELEPCIRALEREGVP